MPDPAFLRELACRATLDASAIHLLLRTEDETEECVWMRMDGAAPIVLYLEQVSGSEQEHARRTARERRSHHVGHICRRFRRHGDFQCVACRMLPSLQHPVLDAPPDKTLKGHQS